jgi:two-component system, chemotaxis family, chemotaxis protein CheY
MWKGYRIRCERRQQDSSKQNDAMKSILLIDDDEALREALRVALERAGYNVVIAGDGKEGLQLYRRLRPDLVVTDIVMDGQEGIETIKTLRRESPLVKIIAMSGGGSMRDSTYLDAARCLGAQRTLDKPFELQHLLTVVRDVLHSEKDPC